MVGAGNLFGAIEGVDGSDPLGQIDVVGEGAGEICQQRLKAPEPVRGDSINYPVEVTVSVAVETDFLCPLFCAQSFQGPGPEEAAVGAVRGT